MEQPPLKTDDLGLKNPTIFGTIQQPHHSGAPTSRVTELPAFLLATDAWRSKKGGSKGLQKGLQSADSESLRLNKG